MAIVNPTPRGGSLPGSVLRETTERERGGRPLRPTAQPSSPIRQLIRTSILTPTPPGSARVTSVAPEPSGVTPAIVEPTTRAAGQVVPPPAAVGNVVGAQPDRPVVQAAAPAGQGAPGASAADPQAASTPAAGSPPPSQVANQPQGQVLGASSAQRSTAQPRSRFFRSPPRRSFGRRIVQDRSLIPSFA